MTLGTPYFRCTGETRIPFGKRGSPLILLFDQGSSGATEVQRQGQVLRVLTERRARPSGREELRHLLVQLRARALAFPGYTFGMIWQDLQEPDRFLTNDSWQSLEHWQRFSSDSRNQDIFQQIEVLLDGPVIIRFYGDA